MRTRTVTGPRTPAWNSESGYSGATLCTTVGRSWSPGSPPPGGPSPARATQASARQSAGRSAGIEACRRAARMRSCPPRSPSPARAILPRVSSPSRIHRPYAPTGDQPQAIDALLRGIGRGDRDQVLLGVTGSGKTFTIANVIAAIGLPTLILSHNKTLAAQLYGEFKGFFPENGVGYFISYYDYYQPEAYVPATNTYIEKDASINDDIDRMRLSSTAMLLERPDVVIVASVSSIYGLGSPEEFKGLMLDVRAGGRIDRDQVLRRLIDIQYARNALDVARGTFRVRGEVVEIHPAYEEHGVRLEFDDDVVTRISIIDPLTGNVLRRQERL